MPKFSMIIPEYMGADKIGPALESLGNQTNKDFEVIIVDDCSPDDSFLKIQSRIKSLDLDVKLIKAIKNSGPGVARNIGLQHASGSYVCFMDTDDYVSTKYFESLNDILSVENIDLIYFGNYHVIGSNKIKYAPIHYYNIDSFVALSSGAIWRFCLKKELIKKYPLPSIRNAEDIAVIPLCILSAKKIEYSDKALYYYVHNNESLSSSYSSQVTYNFVKSFDYTLSYLKEPYSAGLEFHGIKTIIYGAVLNGLKASMEWNEIDSIINNFENVFPHWSQNKYIKSYSIRKRVFLHLVKSKSYRLLKGYVSIHNLLLRYL